MSIERSLVKDPKRFLSDEFPNMLNKKIDLDAKVKLFRTMLEHYIAFEFAENIQSLLESSITLLFRLDERCNRATDSMTIIESCKDFAKLSFITTFVSIENEDFIVKVLDDTCSFHATFPILERIFRAFDDERLLEFLSLHLKISHFKQSNITNLSLNSRQKRAKKETSSFLKSRFRWNHLVNLLANRSQCIKVWIQQNQQCSLASLLSIALYSQEKKIKFITPKQEVIPILQGLVDGIDENLSIAFALSLTSQDDSFRFTLPLLNGVNSRKVSQKLVDFFISSSPKKQDWACSILLQVSKMHPELLSSSTNKFKLIFDFLPSLTPRLLSDFHRIIVRLAIFHLKYNSNLLLWNELQIIFQKQICCADPNIAHFGIDALSALFDLLFTVKGEDKISFNTTHGDYDGNRETEDGDLSYPQDMIVSCSQPTPLPRNQQGLNSQQMDALKLLKLAISNPNQYKLGNLKFGPFQKANQKNQIYDLIFEELEDKFIIELGADDFNKKLSENTKGDNFGKLLFSLNEKPSDDDEDNESGKENKDKVLFNEKDPANLNDDKEAENMIGIRFANPQLLIDLIKLLRVIDADRATEDLFILIGCPMVVDRDRDLRGKDGVFVVNWFVCLLNIFHGHASVGERILLNRFELVRNEQEKQKGDINGTAFIETFSKWSNCDLLVHQSQKANRKKIKGFGKDGENERFSLLSLDCILHLLKIICQRDPLKINEKLKSNVIFLVNSALKYVQYTPLIKDILSILVNVRNFDIETDLDDYETQCSPFITATCIISLIWKHKKDLKNCGLINQLKDHLTALEHGLLAGQWELKEKDLICLFEIKQEFSQNTSKIIDFLKNESKLTFKSANLLQLCVDYYSMGVDGKDEANEFDTEQSSEWIGLLYTKLLREAPNITILECLLYWCSRFTIKDVNRVYEMTDLEAKISLFEKLVKFVRSLKNFAFTEKLVKLSRNFLRDFQSKILLLLPPTQSALSLLHPLQKATRSLQIICNVHSSPSVPLLKRTLESIVFGVKRHLENSGCVDAFWVGNLKHRDIDGNEISSEVDLAAMMQESKLSRSVISEESDDDE